MSIVLCEMCGCEGNTSCGHEPLDKEMNCTLHVPEMICPCCAIDKNHMHPEDPRQQVLFATLEEKE